MGENEISNLKIEMGHTIDTSILIENLDPNHISINQIPIIYNTYYIYINLVWIERLIVIGISERWWSYESKKGAKFYVNFDLI